jgi:hypothetical protein
MNWGARKGENKVSITSLNPHSPGIDFGTRCSSPSTFSILPLNPTKIRIFYADYSGGLTYIQLGQGAKWGGSD